MFQGEMTLKRRRFIIENTTIQKRRLGVIDCTGWTELSMQNAHAGLIQMREVEFDLPFSIPERSLFVQEGLVQTGRQ